MDKNQFKEAARQLLPVMEYLASSMKLSSHLAPGDSSTFVIGMKLTVLDQELLAMKYAELHSFLSQYEALPKEWMYDDEDDEMKDLCERINAATESVFGTKDTLDLMQDSFNEDGQFQSSIDIIGIVSEELRSIHGGNSLTEDSVETIVRVLQAADSSSSVDSAAVAKLTDIPIVTAHSLLEYLQTLGLLKSIEPASKTFELTANGASFIAPRS